MDVSPSEAAEALEAIQTMARKTRRSIANSGAYAFLIVWGFVWLFGFLGSHFLPGKTAGLAWMWLDVLGGVGSMVVGMRMRPNVRSRGAGTSGSQIGWFWLMLMAYCILTLVVAQPIDGKELAMIFIIFAMIGWMGMALLLRFASVWWGLSITALALIGYFLLPEFFYLLMALVGGGGMIGLGFYIRSRW